MEKPVVAETRTTRDRGWLKAFTFLLLCIDALGMVYYIAVEPVFVQSLLVGLSSLAAALVAVVKFIGLAKEGVLVRGVDNFDVLLGDWKFQAAMGFLTLFLWISILYPPFLRPRTGLTVVVQPLFDGEVETVWAGEVALWVASPGSENTAGEPGGLRRVAAQPVMFARSTAFPPVARDNVYEVRFTPFDDERFVPTENSGTALHDAQAETLQVNLRLYPVPVRWEPATARFTLERPSSADPDTGGRLRVESGLPKGIYRYRIAAEGYIAQEGKISIPRPDSLVVRLEPVLVGVSFYADRSLLATTPRPLRSARFRVYGEDGTLITTITGGGKARLPIGQSYHVDARGSEGWDLAGRRYAGSTAFRMTAERARAPLRVPVREVR